MNDAGQWSYYGKVGGAVTTGNEDGGKHVSAQVLYALQHIGVTVPPQTDSYWNGEAGPGDSYGDPMGGGPESAWTSRDTTFMTWNILHFARMLKDAGGVPPTAIRPTTGISRCPTIPTRVPRAERAVFPMKGSALPDAAELLQMNRDVFAERTLRSAERPSSGRMPKT